MTIGGCGSLLRYNLTLVNLRQDYLRFLHGNRASAAYACVHSYLCSTLTPLNAGEHLDPTASLMLICEQFQVESRGPHLVRTRPDVPKIALLDCPFATFQLCIYVSYIDRDRT